MRSPALYSELRDQLRREFRTLRLLNEGGVAFVRGALPICGEDGRELGRFQIEVELLDDFPKSVPLVRETGGQLPRHPDRHVNYDGTACLFVRDETWKYWNKDSTLIQFLNGPVYQFFLGQIFFVEHGTWPFGQRNHFGLGVAEYYFEELETRSLFVVRAFLEFLADRLLDARRLCYCGSFRQLRHCHHSKVLDLRSKISTSVATASLQDVRELIEHLPKKAGVSSKIKLTRSLPLCPAPITAERIRRSLRF